MEHIIGIDLGTTNSEVAVIGDGQPRIIPIDGESIMPSCVGLDGRGKLVVGREAKNQMLLRPDETILSIKRLMGADESVSLGEKEYSPEEISALILGKLRDAAATFLEEEISAAVITVPAYFDDRQRKATRKAGELAGLEVRRIINEPTAAALAYDIEKNDNQTILVYDLGGGTFDVSLVVVENGVVEVKASHGDTKLGGDDFDRLLIDHVAEKFREKSGIDLRTDSQGYNRLWSAVERAKRQLSDHHYAEIKEEYISDEHHLIEEISRSDYEEMIEPLLRKTMDCVHSCLRDAAMLPGAIDRVLMVGGSSRTPLVAELFSREMRAAINDEINPELIVALGAAIQGGVMSGLPTAAVLVDITPYTFGTRAFGEFQGSFSQNCYCPVIKRNTPLPAARSERFATMVDNQEKIDIRVYQGEEPLVSDNTFVGNFQVDSLSAVPAGNEIILTMRLDLDGILAVTASEKSTGLAKTVRMETAVVDGLQRSVDSLSVVDSAVGGGEDGDDKIEEMAGDAEAQEAVDLARELRRRAAKLRSIADETDAAEIKTLITAGREAIAARQWERLAELNESLADLLFYLED
ncbi:MAG: Hsp70 family protein [Pseudomonadota bacterium]|nr:Hsp70 family protein [Pseudomonadota bacterium]